MGLRIPGDLGEGSESVIGVAAGRWNAAVGAGAADDGGSLSDSGLFSA